MAIKRFLVLFFVSISLFAQIDSSWTIEQQRWARKGDIFDTIRIRGLDLIKIDTSNGFVGINTDSALAPLQVTPVLQETGTYRGILIDSPIDDNMWAGITFKAGLTATQRRYQEYQAYDGTRTGLFGMNATNAFIMYDAQLSKHYIMANPTSDLFLSAIGATGSVGINYDAGQVTGTGGLVVFDGTGDGTGLGDRYGAITSGGLFSYNGHMVQCYNTNNTDYLRLNGSSTSYGYFESTLPMAFKSTANAFRFMNSSYATSMYFDPTNEKLGIGTDSPDEMLELEWSANIDIEFGVGTTDTDVTFLTLRSPNGTKYYVTVGDDGTLTTSLSKP